MKLKDLTQTQRKQIEADEIGKDLILYIIKLGHPKFWQIAEIKRTIKRIEEQISKYNQIQIFIMLHAKMRSFSVDEWIEQLNEKLNNYKLMLELE